MSKLVGKCVLLTKLTLGDIKRWDGVALPTPEPLTSTSIALAASKTHDETHVFLINLRKGNRT